MHDASVRFLISLMLIFNVVTMLDCSVRFRTFAEKYVGPTPESLGTFILGARISNVVFPNRLFCCNEMLVARF